MRVGDDELDAAQAPPSQLAQELAPESLGFRGADVEAQDFASPVAVDADGDDDRGRDDAAGAADLHVGRVEPNIGPVAFDGAAEERFDLLVDLLAQPADLALGDAVHAHGANQVVNRTGRDPLHIRLLHDRRDGLLRQPSRFEKAREVAALAQFADTKLHRARSRFPVAAAVAVALGKTVGRAFAMRRPGTAFDIQLHQPLSGEADHPAHEIRVGGLLQKGLKRHSLVGHCRFLGCVEFATRPYRRIGDDHPKPLARYGAIGERASQTAC